MQILDVLEAAAFLKMNPEVLRRKAKLGEVPGRKVGKKWVFVEEHLADFVSGRYPLQISEKLVEHHEVNGQCLSTSAGNSGGYSSPHLMAQKYNEFLGLN